MLTRRFRAGLPSRAFGAGCWVLPFDLTDSRAGHHVKSRSIIQSEQVFLREGRRRDRPQRFIPDIQILSPDAFASLGKILEKQMAKIAKTADRKKVMDTSKSTDCPKCGKPTRIVKRVKDRERNIPGGIFISCSACEFYEKL
jgi:DNA-directed RNA polymerase subunit M/transcription elongation factor TFIIS